MGKHWATAEVERGRQEAAAARALQEAAQEAQARELAARGEAALAARDLLAREHEWQLGELKETMSGMLIELQAKDAPSRLPSHSLVSSFPHHLLTAPSLLP